MSTDMLQRLTNRRFIIIIHRGRIKRVNDILHITLSIYWPILESLSLSQSQENLQ